jgi:predicted transcriptional regulator
MPTLKQIRVVNFLSRRELAKLSGVSESTIVRMEDPKHKSQPEVVEKVLKALGDKIGENLTLEKVEGLNLYNVMRDRRQRTKPDTTEEVA